MNRILIRPAKRWFSKRQQWSFELRAANGEPIDPRETTYNRQELIDTMTRFLTADPLELVVYDRFGNIESRQPLR